MRFKLTLLRELSFNEAFYLDGSYFEPTTIDRNPAEVVIYVLSDGRIMTALEDWTRGGFFSDKWNVHVSGPDDVKHIGVYGIVAE